jgi:tRNA A-37 threonylcarbamoyl transferase component Bud32
MDDLHTPCPACGADTLDIDPRCPSCGQALASEEALRKIGTTVLEHYEVTDVLGQGGMSVVYRGRHKLTEQEVALKILPPELAAHNQVKTRFLEEARALAQLDHPNIVHLYNFGHDQGCLVLAMQLVAGQTWERLILTRGRLDWLTTVSIGIDVLKGLELAHSRGIIHRDMKPSNVLLRTDGSALVMDFGIAKMTTSTRLTATGQTMGTVRYMSPEQVRGQEVDARTDLYSLAVTLYESLCGETPFDGESHFEIMTHHLSTPPPPLGERGVSIPRELIEVIESALRKNPDQRPASARQMRAQLEEIRAAAGPRSAADRSTLADRAPAPAGKGRERPRLWIALAGGAVLLAAVAVFAVLRFGADDAEVRPASAAPTGGERAAAGAADWPEAHRISGDQYAVDERFAEDRLRVLSIGKRDPKEVLAAVRRARRDFQAYLASHGVKQPVAAPPLNVVVVPSARMCDARLYESGAAPAGCEGKVSQYRPREKTLYLADDEEAMAANLPLAVATTMCLHSDVASCDVLVVPFAEAALDR